MSADRAMVLYDGACSLCAGSVRRLRALDWRRRLDFADVRHPAVRSRFPTVDPARALERLQLLPTPTSVPLEGFRALQWIAGRLPLLWLAWPFLHLPGATWLGTRLYDHVARYRFLFSRCPRGDRG